MSSLILTCYLKTIINNFKQLFEITLLMENAFFYLFINLNVIVLNIRINV